MSCDCPQCGRFEWVRVSWEGLVHLLTLDGEAGALAILTHAREIGDDVAGWVCSGCGNVGMTVTTSGDVGWIA